ncbi:MAG: protein kinase [Polyangiaceae bacterium]|nr:protein kinase [Polyangiaceae bacterium]
MGRERIVAGRFGILGRVGAGGMGAVYRAVDHTTGNLVAVKEIHGLQPQDHDRFARECSFLASLDEPGIVRYVAHGTTGITKFLAMEWVDGPTLSDEIKRRGFRITETIELVTAVAKIVAAIHKRGIVHRDIKPSNIVLQAGDHRRPKLLDFGVARLEGAAAGDVTTSGLVVGSAGYLSPEQATGRKDIDARADVFALGCLLFKCLTGRVPFRSDDPIGVLLKITLEEAPRLRDFVSGVMPELDDLVARLLSRDRDERPRDAAEVAKLLAELPLARDDDGPPSVEEGAITGAEQRLAVLVLARTDQFASREPGQPQPKSEPDRIAIERALRPLDMVPEVHSDGTVVLVVTGRGESLGDLARRAVRAASAIRHADPTLFLAIAAGRATDGRTIKIGEAVDRASDLLSHLMLHHQAGDVAMDNTVASLVDSAYEIESFETVSKLLSDRTDSRIRSVLGRRAASAGRDHELGFVRGLIQQTIEDGKARSTIVIGEPGMGKTRLCHDVVGGIDRFSTEVWVIRADPWRKDTPFGALAPLILELAGIDGSDDDAARWKKLVGLVDASAPGPYSYRIVEFFSEICGIPILQRKPSRTFDAARRDPTSMGESTRRALSDFVAAVAALRPLFIALEDVHWLDQATLSFLDATLRALEDRPIFVLALAREDLATTYPNLFAGRRVQTLHLEALSAASSARMARELLGDDADEGVVDRIVECAGGNPFFIEELARAAIAGSIDNLPDSMLAVLESRFDALSPEARRVLRAGAVFGSAFWDGGAQALAPRIDVAQALAELERAGLVQKARRSRLRGHHEYTFRHEPFVEAAYACIPDPDRKKAHRAVAKWLEASGERDPLLLAEHYERGGDGQSAVALIAVAAHLALEASDLPQAIKLCDRALACGAFGEERGRVHVTAAEARYWLGRAPEALAHARDALARLTPGDAGWCAAASVAIASAGRTGNKDALKTFAALVFSLPRTEAFGPHRIILFSQAAIELVFAGKLDIADQALSQIPAGLAQKDPATAAWFYRARAWRAMASGDPCGCGMLMKRSFASFDQVGDVRNACVQRVNLAHAALCVGQLEEAADGFASAIEHASELGLAGVVARARLYLGLTRSYLGQFDEAEQDERMALQTLREQRDERAAATSTAFLARVLLERHRVDEAEAIVRDGLASIEGHLPVRALLLATLAQSLTQRARLAKAPVPIDALRAVHDAEALLGEIGGVDEGEGYVRWTVAHVLWEAKDLADAARALTEAKTSLDARVRKITVETLREPFLQRIPEHALTKALFKVLCARSAAK